MVVPIRGNLEHVRRFMVGDLYIGRGSKQNGLSKSPWCNSFKVALLGRQRAIERFASQLSSDEQLKSKIWCLSGRRLICHCLENQACHADVLITEFRRQFPSAFDRDLLGGEPPSSTVLNFLGQLRGEPEQDDGASADEGAPGKEAGWKGQGKPMQVGVANNEFSSFHEGVHHRFHSCLDDAFLTFHVQHVECSLNVVELRHSRVC